jgi:hypothetical protein
MQSALLMARDDSRSLRGLADKCRWLARGASVVEVRNCLNDMAAGYAREAEEAAEREAKDEPAG